MVSPIQLPVFLSGYFRASQIEQNTKVLLPSVFFIISALTELGLARHRKKEQRFGPSPANNYTSGYGAGGAPRRGFGSLFRRRQQPDAAAEDPNALPAHPEPGHLRQSYNTEATHVDDTLPAPGDTNGYHKHGEAGYGQQTAAPAMTGVQPQTNYGHRYGDGTYNV